jgi:hypothetical protein
VEPVVPDYARSVAAVVPALLGVTDARWLPAPVHGARAVVLLVVDGLGWHALADAPGHLAHLRTFEGGPVPTVLPATTSAALTAITTGVPPAQHGITGFRMVVDGAVLNVLRWQCEGRGVTAPDPTTLQRHPPFLGRTVPVVAKADHRASGFTAAHLRGMPFHGWRAPSTIVELCRRLVDDGHPLVYAYYPSVDEVAHEFGLFDGAYAAELAFADDLIARLLDVLPGDCALLVTADHGQVDLAGDAWIELERDVARLVHRQAGDARFRHLHAHPGAQHDLAAACRERFGALAWVRSRKEMLGDAWLGEWTGGPAAGRIGDVVLMPFEAVGFVDPALPRERQLMTAHGAPTAAEVLVPLLAARGTA